MSWRTSTGSPRLCPPQGTSPPQPAGACEPGGPGHRCVTRLREAFLRRDAPPASTVGLSSPTGVAGELDARRAPALHVAFSCAGADRRRGAALTLSLPAFSSSSDQNSVRAIPGLPRYSEPGARSARCPSHGPGWDPHGARCDCVRGAGVAWGTSGGFLPAEPWLWLWAGFLTPWLAERRGLSQEDSLCAWL